MALSFNNDKMTINVVRYMNSVSRQINKSLERLATGSKLNHASDNAAAILVAENFNSQIRGYDMGSVNVQQGLSMLQTADDALQQINSHLQNIRDIAVSASNGTTTTAQFTAYEASLTAELDAINSIASNSKFGTHVLLDGSVSGGSAFNIQYGPNSGDAIDIKSAFTNNTYGGSGLSITQTTLASTANATTLLGQIDTALGTVSSNLATLGGYENRMEDQLNSISIAKTNAAASLSAIRDVDLAQESANLARLQVLQQAGAYTLVQANRQSSLALSLLQ